MIFTKLLSYKFIFLFFLAIPAYADAESFFVNKDFDAQARSAVDASIEVVGEHAYFYTETSYKAALPPVEISRLNQRIVSLSSEFDSKIYPRLREILGSEKNPGIDNDSKIIILFHNMPPGVGGYVRDSDSFARSVTADSNAREMMYINIEEVLNSDLGSSYIAHEFQHLITYNQKTLRGLDEEKWLNEARSEYAPTLLGYSKEFSGSYLKKRVGEFLAHPSEALLDWRGRSIDHSSVSLFMHYLVDRYGTGILTSMMAASSAGANSIDDALLALGRSERFVDVFRDWILAVYINSSIDGAPDMFKYKDINLAFGNLRVLPTTTFRIYDNYSSGANFVIDNWSGQWHRFVPGSLGEETTLHVKIFSPAPRGLSIPYIINDFSGSTEVRFFDLTQGNILSVPQFGNLVSSVVITPTFMAEGTENSSSVGSFSLEAFVSNSLVNRFSEGALVRAAGDSKVYIVKNSPKIGGVFKRWIQTEQVFGFYKHFTWNDIIEIKPALLSTFSESLLIRRTGDFKVYEVNALGRKTWLNMTAAEFTASGRSWDAVYEVNNAEFNWYL